MNTATGNNHPRYSHLECIVLIAFANDELKWYPTPYSKIKNGRPKAKWRLDKGYRMLHLHYSTKHTDISKYFQDRQLNQS